MNDFSKIIASNLNLSEKNVSSAIDLLFEKECSIPFVARYRKEVTGLMDEVSLQKVRDLFLHHQDLENTRKRYLKVVDEYSKVKPELAKILPELHEKFNKCKSKQMSSCAHWAELRTASAWASPI